MPHATAGTPLVPFMFHPTLTIDDRAKAEDFFRKVFDIQSVYMGDITKDPSLEYNPDYPLDYSLFTWISDVWFDSYQPDRRRPGAVNPDRPRLVEIGWFVETVARAVSACEKQGIRVWDSTGQTLVTSATLDCATSSASPDIALFWLDPDDTGLGLELVHMTQDFGNRFGKVCFPPLANGWIAPAAAEPNPLGIEYCAYHSVLTDNVARALRWSRDVLGGKIIAQRHDAAFKTGNTYVWLGQAVIEFAKPIADDGVARRAHQDKAATLHGKPTDDVYWSIAFKVKDLKAASRHLEQVGVPFDRTDDHRIHIDPDHGLSVRWCFTDQSVPGDPRAA